jgi:hypothetical protein
MFDAAKQCLKLDDLYSFMGSAPSSTELVAAAASSSGGFRYRPCNSVAAAVWGLLYVSARVLAAHTACAVLILCSALVNHRYSNTQQYVLFSHHVLAWANKACGLLQDSDVLLLAQLRQHLLLVTNSCY